MSQIKSLGFSGVILCYGKEIQIQKPSQPRVDDFKDSHQPCDPELDIWKQGNLETLDMLGDRDYLGMKYDAPMSIERNLADLNE